MSGPPKTKVDPALTRHSIPVAFKKTSATAEACTKERHSYKPLRKEFRRDGFNYRQVTREGGIAFYEQRWTGCPDAAVCFEVICVRQRQGFQIGRRFVEPAEVYPASELWGLNGFTFTERKNAWDKFFEIALEEPANQPAEGR